MGSVREAKLIKQCFDKNVISISFFEWGLRKVKS